MEWADGTSGMPLCMRPVNALDWLPCLGAVVEPGAAFYSSFCVSHARFGERIAPRRMRATRSLLIFPECSRYGDTHDTVAIRTRNAGTPQKSFMRVDHIRFTDFVIPASVS
jgi:hypothetical protein